MSLINTLAVMCIAFPERTALHTAFRIVGHNESEDVMPTMISCDGGKFSVDGALDLVEDDGAVAQRVEVGIAARLEVPAIRLGLRRVESGPGGDDVHGGAAGQKNGRNRGEDENLVTKVHEAEEL